MPASNLVLSVFSFCGCFSFVGTLVGEEVDDGSIAARTGFPVHGRFEIAQERRCNFYEISRKH